MYKNLDLNPWWLTGIFDAGGSFLVSLVKIKNSEPTHKILVSVEISLNYKDKLLLYNIQSMLNVGTLHYDSTGNICKWKVSGINEIYDVIIPHFKTYPLITQKRADFETFVKIIGLVKLGRHYSQNGLQKIVNLKSSLNMGVSKELTKHFPDTIVVPRALVEFENIKDPHWVLGFTEGEACFFVRIYNSPKSKLNRTVQVAFIITQHIRDLALLEGLKNFFNCGRVNKRSTNACDFSVNSLKSIEDNVIPLYKKYPIKGQKLLNFQDFNLVVNMMTLGKHKTKEGLGLIEALKKGMNTGRNSTSN